MQEDNNSESGRIGDPYAAGNEPLRPGDPAESSRDAPPGANHRRGDTGLGHPRGTPDVVRTVSREETHRHQRQQQQALEQRFEQHLAELAEADRGWMLPQPIRTALNWAMVVIAALLGLLLVGQAVRLVNELSQLPRFTRWLAGFGAALFGAVLLYVFVRILWALVKLNRSPRVNLRALSVLRQRRRLQALAEQHHEQARDALLDYLRDYTLEDGKAVALRAAGLRAEEVETLRSHRDRLLETDRPISAGDWLEEFARGFQHTLDAAAGRRVSQYAKRVAAGTAMAPVAFVDQMIVLYSCSAMVKDLLVLYQLRPAFGQTGVLIARGIIHAYLSGMFEEATENAADQVADWAGDGLGALGGTIGRAASAKAAEAGLNSLLMLRLGRQCRRLLQPCRL
ncbi:MAG: DUF697 domain-containing protein [Phycisphaerae bacterium]